MNYYIVREVSRPFDAVVRDVAVRLESAGFSMLSDIDLRRVLEAATGAPALGYRILGACNPQLAQEAFRIDDRLGALLPCNVIVHERADNRVEIASVDPVAALDRSGNPALARIAFELRRKLSSVVEAVES